jgi:hypothetical protein
MAEGAILATAAVVSALATSYGAYSQDQAARKGLNQQKKAQQNAQNAALAQEMKSDAALMKANQKKPDIASLLTQTQEQKPKGTLLTGQTQGNTLLGA